MHAATAARIRWPLMKNNILREDLKAVRDLLDQDDPILTQSRNVRAFEREWSDWLGVRFSVFVNSGSSANLITMAALRHRFGPGEVIVPTITWVSDIAAVLHAGLTPAFVDIDPRTLGMDLDHVLEKIGPNTRAVFLTHVLGFVGMTTAFVDELKRRNVLLVEDVCESHGAKLAGRKLGSFGWASNFSFYYAHHLSTIEGGMVCTNDADLYETLRMYRAHGMVREADSDSLKRDVAAEHPDLNPEFIFTVPGFNVRSTEINAVVGRAQLPRLDANVDARSRNFRQFLSLLDRQLFFTDFAIEGSSNYAFPLVLRQADEAMWRRVCQALRGAGVEFRRGTAGGGNQTRQPYLRPIVGPNSGEKFPQADHVHFFGMYIGNYPSLTVNDIRGLCELLNAAAREATP